MAEMLVFAYCKIENIKMEHQFGNEEFLKVIKCGRKIDEFITWLDEKVLSNAFSTPSAPIINPIKHSRVLSL